MHEVTKLYLSKSGTDLLADCNGGPMGTVVNMAGPQNAVKRALYQVLLITAGLTGGAKAQAMEPELFTLSADGLDLLAPNGSVVNCAGPSAAAARRLYSALKNRPDEDLLDMDIPALIDEAKKYSLAFADSTSLEASALRLTITAERRAKAADVAEVANPELPETDADLAGKTVDELQDIFIEEGLADHDDPADGEGLENEVDDIRMRVFITLARPRKAQADKEAEEAAFSGKELAALCAMTVEELAKVIEEQALAGYMPPGPTGDETKEELAGRIQIAHAAQAVADEAANLEHAALNAKTVKELHELVEAEGLTEYAGADVTKLRKSSLIEAILDARTMQAIAEANEDQDAQSCGKHPAGAQGSGEGQGPAQPEATGEPAAESKTTPPGADTNS
jgi:hypothetical protein